jgi:hypothetical protein
MYATAEGLTWTSDLLHDLYSVYNKYFAFILSSEGMVTSGIQLADHYG